MRSQQSHNRSRRAAAQKAVANVSDARCRRWLLALLTSKERAASPARKAVRA